MDAAVQRDPADPSTSPLQSEISFYANPHPKSRRGGTTRNWRESLLQCGHKYRYMRKGTTHSGFDHKEAI